MLEALSATLVMATYGIELTVCLQGDALSLLCAPTSSPSPQASAFKSAYAMVESFEFYDILPIWIDQQDSDSPYLLHTQIEHRVITLDSQCLQSFDRVIYW